jgi:hypothetical protein
VKEKMRERDKVIEKERWKVKKREKEWKKERTIERM